MSIFMILLIAVLVALAVWGVVATVAGLGRDGYGRPEIRDRVRHVERLG
ncbi:hypothetical protein [Agromyces sp. S2-1-8]|nr:hypothetical protein [Agromyces sp. S2-1-8]MCD5347754.1 hypothetical protein [Agromyces sp. S2-1-8]